MQVFAPEQILLASLQSPSATVKPSPSESSETTVSTVWPEACPPPSPSTGWSAVGVYVTAGRAATSGGPGRSATVITSSVPSAAWTPVTS